MKIAFVSQPYESLGIQYLSASLKKRGHSTSFILDPFILSGYHVTDKLLAKIFDFTPLIISQIDDIAPDCICMPVISDHSSRALSISREIKKYFAIPIIWGGMQPTTLPEFTISQPEVDFICIGEGDHAIVDLVDAIESGSNTTNIENIWAKQNGEIFRNTLRPLIGNLDQLPFPDKDLHYNNYPKFKQVYSAITSRGCPYSCTYCGNSQLIKIYKDNNENKQYYRKRSVDNVIAELEAAKKKYKPEIIRFQDEIFTIDKEWLGDFSKKYSQYIDLPYFCYIHPSNADEEVMQLLENSGCMTVFMGFGTESKSMRENILNRYYKNESVAEVIKRFKKSRIYIFIDCLIGLPNQTREEVIELASFFNNNRPDCVLANFLRYYSNLGISEIAQKSNILESKEVQSLKTSIYNDRIILKEKDYTWLKKSQTLIAATNFLPKSWIAWSIQKKAFNYFPPINFNNCANLLDSIFLLFSKKKRLYSGINSLFQSVHFIFYFLGKFVKGTFMIKRKKVIIALKKFGFIYSLGLTRMSIRKWLQTIRYVIKTTVFKQDCPGAVILGVSYACQQHCIHCSIANYKVKKAGELDVIQWKEAISNLAKWGVPKINLFGGEPLLNASIVELTHYAYKKGLSVSIDTNGVRLTEPLFFSLKKAGINNINISIDSADPEVHDKLRGWPGGYKKAVDAIQLCVKNNVPCVLNTYASKRSLYSGDLARIFSLGKKLHVTGVKVLFPIMSGRWKDAGSSELLTTFEKKAVMRLLEPGFSYLESPLYSVVNGRKVCEALGRKMVFISPYGDVQMCYSTPMSFGNVKDSSASSLIQKMWQDEKFCSINKKCDCVMNDVEFREQHKLELVKNDA